MHRGKVRETWELGEFAQNRQKIEEMGWKDIDTGKYRVNGMWVGWSPDFTNLGTLTLDEYRQFLDLIGKSYRDANRYLERLFFRYEVS